MTLSIDWIEFRNLFFTIQNSAPSFFSSHGALHLGSGISSLGIRRKSNVVRSIDPFQFKTGESEDLDFRSLLYAGSFPIDRIPIIFPGEADKSGRLSQINSKLSQGNYISILNHLNSFLLLTSILRYNIV